MGRIGHAVQNQGKPQGAAKKKDAVKPVSKPYLTGKPWNRNSVKRALGVFGTNTAFIFVNIVVGSALSLDSAFLRVLLNAAVILVCLAVLYSQGIQAGEGDVAFGEICYLQKQEGRQVPPEDEKRCFHRLHGLMTAFAGTLPFLALTALYAVMAVKQTYVLQSLPSWVGSYSGVEGVGDALRYYQQRTPMGLLEVLRLLERIFCLPYVNIFGHGGADALLTFDRLSPLTMLMPILAYWIGFLRGPRNRAMVHGSIQYSQRRRERKRRREQKQRGKRNENREII